MLKRHSFAIIIAAISITLVTPAFGQLELPRLSPQATVSQRIGLTDVTITYSRPSVRGRVIWGDLVPYGQVWRTGANEATTFETTDDVVINGQKLAAGKYSLATIPGEDEWTIIFNREAELWGAYEYDAAKDALRVRVKPDVSPLGIWQYELLTFDFVEVSMSSATAVLFWEKLAVPFKIEVDTQSKVMANIREALSRMEDWRTPYQAANYAFSAKTNLDEATKWVDRSISLSENYQNLSLKARMLAEQGRTSEAIALAEKAVKAGRTSAQRVDTAPTEKLIAEWKTKSRIQ